MLQITRRKLFKLGTLVPVKSPACLVTMGSISGQVRSRHRFAPLGSEGSGEHGGDDMQLKGIVFDMVRWPLCTMYFECNR